MATPTIPENYRTAVVAHIMLDAAADAIDFYKRAFGAEELFRIDGEDGGILHAEISVQGSTLMLGDADSGFFGAPNALGGTTVALHVFVHDVDALTRRAVEAGAELVRPPADQFHGDRTSIVKDPFGHVWVLLTHLEDLSPDELTRRVREHGAER
ncbi:VOC family protein [Streptomyces cinereoruber]|uniref:VOC family protein n=1 Tax=Streptomyces cinereoruber TaxID=67260 RepID=UPI0036351604